MALILPEIQHEYLFHLDTEETKNSVFDQCRAEGKEAAYSTFGTAQNDSEYQPAPTVEPDYYMQYCSSDGYDYLKDYRLVWGYTIGIIEQDVICSLTTGEHLAEGKEACDTYEAENAAGENVDWKRGIWLKFSGNRNVSPNRIGEVVLPNYIISLKDLCKALQIRGGCNLESFNTDYILNISRAFNDPQIRIKENIEFNFENILNAEYTFSNITTNDKISFSKINDIDYKYTFYQAKITKVPKGFNNVGGTYCFSHTNINDISDVSIKIYSHQFEETKIVNVDNTSKLIATNNITSCFELCIIKIFKPIIDWSKCTIATHLLYDNNNPIDEVVLDFTTATKDITVNYFNNNYTITKLNIIANPNIKLLGNLFDIYSNAEIIVTNILYCRNGYIFSLYDVRSTKIIGNFNTHYFIHCANRINDGYNILTNDSDVYLYNDDDVSFSNTYGLINYYVYRNATIGKININFDNCSIIGFYKRDDNYYKDYTSSNIIINSNKNNIKIYNHLIIDIDLYVNNNTNIELYGNSLFYDLIYNYTPDVYHKINIIKQEDNIKDLTAYYPTCVINAEEYNINAIYDSNSKYYNYKILYIDKCNDITINNFYRTNEYDNAYSNTYIIIENKCNKINMKHSDIAGENIYISCFNKDINLTLNDYRIIDNKKVNLFSYNTQFYNLTLINEKISSFINFPILTTNDEESDYLCYVNKWCEGLDNKYIYKNIYSYTNSFNRDIYTICNYICNGVTINNIPIKTINLTEEEYKISSIDTLKHSNSYNGNIILYDTINNKFDIDFAYGTIKNGWLLDFNNSPSNNEFIIRTGTIIQNYINDNITLNIEPLDESINDNNHNNTILAITSSCINLISIIININNNILSISIDSIILSNITNFIFNNIGTTKYNKNFDIKEASKLSQESINSIVNPSNFTNGCTLTINTIPFQYITEEQKQALVNAGVTLVEYIPQTE